MIRFSYPISIILLFAFPLYSNANEVCFKNHIKEDMCIYAKKIASESSKSLPMKISENMTIVAINSILNKVVIVTLLNYDHQHLKNTYSGSLEAENKAKSFIRNYAKSNACSQKPTKAFIGLGGEIEYKYTFSDGEIFDTSTITRCE